jgi:hypothetical protein
MQLASQQPSHSDVPAGQGGNKQHDVSVGKVGLSGVQV